MNIMLVSLGSKAPSLSSSTLQRSFFFNRGPMNIHYVAEYINHTLWIFCLRIPIRWQDVIIEVTFNQCYIRYVQANGVSNLTV